MQLAAQPNTAKPHEIRVPGATGNATDTQQGHQYSATHTQNDKQLHVAFAWWRNSQLTSLTAHRLSKELVAAVMLGCDYYGDNDSKREAMRRECLAVPSHLKPDLLEHLQSVTQASRSVKC